MQHLLITNARAFTADPANPWAEAVYIVGNRIEFVGSQAAAKAHMSAATRVIDAGGCTLMPGIHDAHYHLLMGALRREHIDLEAVKSLAELETAIKAYDPKQDWVQGRGLAYDVVAGGGFLTRQHLDAIEPNRPVVLTSLDLHTIWANTKALEFAGVLYAGESSAPGSEILRDENGLATGQINEDLVFFDAYIPQPSPAEVRAALRNSIADMNALGITSVTNMDGFSEQIHLYADMAANDEFDLRIQVPYSVTPKTRVDQILAEAVPLRDQYQTGKVRAGSVKLFIDGVIESGTAYMLDPYTLWPETVGQPLYETDHYNALIAEADKQQLQVKVHAIGDAGVRMTLDAYANAQTANGTRDSRHRIEHIETLHNEDLPRFKELGVIASMQPLHFSRPADNYFENWMHCIGEWRYQRAFRTRELRELGIPVPYGSDWPVVTFDPYLGMSAALRNTPLAAGERDNSDSLAEVLASYTSAAAYAEFQDGVKGQLKRGMLADVVLMDCDLFEKDSLEIVEARPLLTVCDGKIVFENK